MAPTPETLPSPESSGEGVPPVRANVAELYLVRHGTTTLNVQNRYRGRRDVPLDAQGWADAVDAARALSPLNLTAVYAGPLRRTINTAQVIADECRIPDVRILHGLINLDYAHYRRSPRTSSNRCSLRPSTRTQAWRTRGQAPPGVAD